MTPHSPRNRVPGERKVAVHDRTSVETTDQLISVLKNINKLGEDIDLDATYVIELLGEHLTAGSVRFSVRIRLAEDVRK